MLEPDFEIEEAIKYLKKYIDTYPAQAHYKGYHLNTFVDDMIYGLGVSISNGHAFAGGFKIFKEKLREHLKK